MLAAPSAGEAHLKLNDPLLIYSRLDLNRMLLERAERAGAQIEKARVLRDRSRHGAGWQLRTSAGTPDADFCIVATGARNPLRDVGTELTRTTPCRRWATTFPATRRASTFSFCRAWKATSGSFRAADTFRWASAARASRPARCAGAWSGYMTERGIAWKGAAFYSHLLPSLDAASWRNNRVAGRRLDGGGRRGRPGGSRSPAKASTTPSARRTWRRGRCFAKWASWRRSCAHYRDLLRRDFAADLEFGSRLAKRVFLGRFLFGSVPARMVQFTRRSPRFSAIMQDLFAGKQPYSGLEDGACCAISTAACTISA